MFAWDAERIRFLREASEYTPFHAELARRAAAFFPKSSHVCDAGCGLGYLSIELAKRCARVTAADIAPEALSVLRDNVQKQGIPNIMVWEADVFALPADVWFDGMAFCFFGGTQEILRCVAAHCKGKAVLFKKNWTMHRFTSKETPLARFTFPQTCAELDAAGVRFESASFALDMGQPFASLADAARFFRLHDRTGGTRLSEAEIAARLTATDSDIYPYYLPSELPVGMIVLDAGAVRKAFSINTI